MGDSHKMGRRKGRGSTMQGNNHSFLSETVRGGYITNVRLKRLPHQKSGIPSTFDVAAINDRSFGQKVPSKTTHTHTHTKHTTAYIGMPRKRERLAMSSGGSILLFPGPVFRGVFLTSRAE